MFSFLDTMSHSKIFEVSKPVAVIGANPFSWCPTIRIKAEAGIRLKECKSKKDAAKILNNAVNDRTRTVSIQ
jgi:hypothetical protein